ncbi:MULTISPECIES: hypothetical protein [unclassified Bradyrhizobium]|uniref:hypothetical protein n=1 Tax=unclassified Bradyrhizobium TaxID=2631580 RepID=UPI0028ECD694|nr:MULTISPECIES: hypothetical protein [unclassified Bradyrhizobium]
MIVVAARPSLHEVSLPAGQITMRLCAILLHGIAIRRVKIACVEKFISEANSAGSAVQGRP